MDVKDFAPEMRPGGHLGDTVGGVELVVAGIAVGLQEAGEAAGLGSWMGAGAILVEVIPDQRRTGGAGAAVVDDIGP
ncbi:hypothetical protein GCM10008023_26670 [Sphingomonas glacialis]|uniref:Uncharacterized protein n=1 Tax=Sphingomonas glacialis TaxID=658225 RepID=A0ABQ3LLB0_9SPHN|nr:hypothetical protein GCM10008023_26670 [Sphingomonas glacialis]